MRRRSHVLSIPVAAATRLIAGRGSEGQMARDGIVRGALRDASYLGSTRHVRRLFSDCYGSEETAVAAAAVRVAAAAVDGVSLPVCLAMNLVRFVHDVSGRDRLAGGGVVSASFLNAKPAVGGIGVEPRQGGVLRVLFTVASDAVADTVVRSRRNLRDVDPSAAVFDVLSDREEAQHRALWPAFLAAKAAGKRAQFHRARLVVDGERLFIVQETVPLGMLAGRGFGEIMGRLLPAGGDFASDAQLDAIVDALMAQHAPALRPTRQSVIDTLPMLRVPSASDAGRGGETKGANASVAAADDGGAAPDEFEGQGGSEGGASSSSSGSGGGQAGGWQAGGHPPTDGAKDGSTCDDRFACCSAGEACTVCTESFQSSERVVELPCQHCFHGDCIKPWLAEHNTCPVCRFALEVEDRPRLPQPPAATRAQRTASVAELDALTAAALDHTRGRQTPLTSMLSPAAWRARASAAPGGHGGIGAAGTGGAEAALLQSGSHAAGSVRRRRRVLEQAVASAAARLEELQSAAHDALRRLTAAGGGVVVGAGVGGAAGRASATPLCDLSRQVAAAQAEEVATRARLRRFDEVVAPAWAEVVQQQQQPPTQPTHPRQQQRAAALARRSQYAPAAAADAARGAAAAQADAPVLTHPRHQQRAAALARRSQYAPAAADAGADAGAGGRGAAAAQADAPGAAAAAAASAAAAAAAAAPVRPLDAFMQPLVLHSAAPAGGAGDGAAQEQQPRFSAMWHAVSLLGLPMRLAWFVGSRLARLALRRRS
ncbi:hypothetical protein FOA52_005754 [Chlamydomonas sp. UWO 241]|nr:hypothetical protein FOA52_005754 [Chlamydomonas sp. UWO 241]